MNFYSRTPRIQTGIILLLCFAALIVTAVYRYSKNNGQLHNLTCRSAIEIVRNTSSFRGIIDIKTGGSKGIVNIDGIIKDAENNEQTVQRMVLLRNPATAQARFGFRRKSKSPIAKQHPPVSFRNSSPTSS